MEKRTRSANFTIAEREILLEIVKENRNLLENKGTSDVSNREKNIGWSIVEEEFNASSVVTKRSAKCLRKCWENLKKAARKSVAAEKEEIFRTGGGLPKAAVRDTILEGVLSLISPSSRIENNYDCDAPGKPKGRENVTDDILKIEIPTDQAFSDWSCWNPKKLSQPASQPLQFATNGHISSTVSEASDDPLTEHLFVTQAVSTSSPCSTQAAVEGHPPTPIMLLHPSSSIPIPSSSNTTELITTSQSKSSPPLQIRYRMSAWRGRRRPANPTAAAPPPPSPSQSAEEVSRALLQARLDLVELKKKLALEEHEWKKELHREQMLEQKLRNRLLLLEMETSVEEQWHPVQIKEEPQEEQDIDENGPQEEKKEPFTNLEEEEEEEQQEGTEENEEEEVKRPVAVYLPVKVELEQEEEEEDEEEVAPVAVFLMSKEEPKEEVEVEDEGPPAFSDASEKKEEISESSGRESTVEGTSSDSQALVRSTIGQHSREETHHCSICQKSISKERWTGHMKIHSGGKKYECSVCQKRFSEKVTLDVHMRIHTMEKRHVCSVCQTSFTQSGSLARHMRIHTGERPYECSICERNFYNKSNLNTHMLSHTGEKKHRCSVCQRSFSLKKNLVKHTLVHTGERPYRCSVCGKGFIQRGSLMEHMRTHTGETSIHNCSICQKSFTQRGNLNVHMLTHTGERPHSCSICHKSFNQGGNLVRHMRTHTGEKPHTCSICQKSFNRRGHLELHMQTHTSYTSIYP